MEPLVTREYIETLIRRQGCLNDEKPFTDDLKLVDDLGLDSYDKVELILMMETEFHIEIREDEFPEGMTFGDLVAKIEAIRDGTAS